MNNIKCIEEVKLWNKGYCRLWDFSNANMSQEAREEACALVSSACHGKAIRNPKKHFEKLLTENGGRASEILGFIPVVDEFGFNLIQNDDFVNNYLRFGYLRNKMFYTNLRTTFNYVGESASGSLLDENPINGFVVMQIKIPQMILLHHDRHKMFDRQWQQNWQSNRSKHEIEYFENDEVSVINHMPIAKSTKTRQELVNKGDFGLRYTTGWLCGWLQDPMTWDNLFNVRLIPKSGTQKEMQEIVTAMYNLIVKHYNVEYKLIKKMYDDI